MRFTAEAAHPIHGGEFLTLEKTIYRNKSEGAT